MTTFGSDLEDVRMQKGSLQHEISPTLFLIEVYLPSSPHQEATISILGEA